MTRPLGTTARLFALAFAAAFICFATSVPSVAKPVPSCKQIYLKWQKLSSRGAFATTGGRSVYKDGTSCGYSFGFTSKSKAIDRALVECRKANRKSKNKGKCTVIKTK
jgi:hypothetical protein